MVKANLNNIRRIQKISNWSLLNDIITINELFFQDHYIASSS